MTPDVDPREYCKIRYSAPPGTCKCGNCQLVPAERLVEWSDALEAASSMIERLQAEHTRSSERTEDQYGISKWADETFGPASSNARVAARANEEMAELLRALTADDTHPKAAEEVADVVIVLFRLMTRLGADMGAEIDRKMEINRARQWNLTADGHGYHVRNKPSIAPVSSPVTEGGK